MPVSLTNKYIFFLLAIAINTKAYAVDKADSLKQKIGLTQPRIDSLQKQLEFSNDSLKGNLYTQIAMQYLNADTISDKLRRARYREIALSNTMKALHYYSKYRDSIGLRISFDHLALIYRAQKKYAQAKWFILQSNTLSRERNDVREIITSLITLAGIKSDIGDYDLALCDLAEAWSLTIKKHLPEQASLVQLSYAGLYTQIGETKKAALASKQHQEIDDSLLKAKQLLLIASLRADEMLTAAKKKELPGSNRAQANLRVSKTTGLLPYLSFSLF